MTRALVVNASVDKTGDNRLVERYECEGVCGL